jgi:hypothetical protein
VFKLLVEAGTVPQAVGKWIQRDSWASKDPPTYVGSTKATIYLPSPYSVASKLDDAVSSPGSKEILESLRAVNEYPLFDVPTPMLDVPDAET